MVNEVHTDTYEGPDRRSESPEWHTNKNYLLSIIFLTLSNIGATIWWASGINHDVQALKDRPDLTERVIKLEATVELHNQYFRKLTKTLDDLNEVVRKIDKEQARRKYIFDRVEKNAP